MPNRKITELTALTDPDANDLLAIVDDPSGSPVTKQITATKLVKSLNNQAATFVAASDSLHKERADYVCDGVNDDVELKAAQDNFVTINEIFTKSGSNPLTGLSGYGCVWYDDNKYYYYKPGTPMIRYYSNDGVNFISEGNTDINSFVPRIWKEGATWYLLSRRSPDTGKIYAASSADGMTWTYMNAGNPVLEAGGDWEGDGSIYLDPSGIIKVDTTYYLFYNNVSKSPREIGYATSTDLVTWTKYANNPIFTGNRFCVDLFKYGDYYYMVVPHFSGYHHADAGLHAFEELELYRCTSVTFHKNEREFLGVVLSLGGVSDWDNFNLDTPTIAVTNIQKTSFVNNRLECYYYAKGRIGLAIAALEDIPTSTGYMGGTFVMLPGHYNISENMLLRENIDLHAEGAVVVYSGATTTINAAIMPSDNVRISGIEIIDKSEEVYSVGIYGRDSGRVEIQNVSIYNFAYGVWVRTKYNILLNSFLSGNRMYGVYVTGQSDRIERNVIENFDKAALDIKGKDQTVINNIIRKGIADAVYTSDVYIRNADHVYFANNQILLSEKLNGIQIYSTCEDNTVQIQNNKIVSTITNPIVLEGGVKCLIKNNVGYTTKKSGASTGTGAQQPIAHGLAATPTKVILWNIEDGANPYQSAAADGTNIKITAVINQDYGWEAEVV